VALLDAFLATSAVRVNSSCHLNVLLLLVCKVWCSSGPAGCLPRHVSGESKQQLSFECVVTFGVIYADELLRRHSGLRSW
jgi:hypothetical protein